MSNKADWTVMVYMAGDNNLSAAGDTDLEEMRRVGSSDRVHVLAEFDNAGDRGTQRYHVERSGVGERVEALGETDSGSPDVLLDFIAWGAREYPAKRYALVLWNHGSGWRPDEVDRIARSVDAPGYSEREIAERSSSSLGRTLFRTSLKRILELPGPAERAICSDDGSGHSLDTLELERVLKAAVKLLGQPIDLLGMDACLMSNVEVAYQVRDHVRYIVASEENEPNNGWPYDQVLARLVNEPTIATADLAAAIVEDYIQFYVGRNQVGPVTQAAVELAHIDQLVVPLDELANSLVDRLPDATTEMWHAQRKSARFLRNTLWDIGDFCRALHGRTAEPATQAAAENVRAALRPGAGRFVTASGHHGSKVERCDGVSFYLPPPIGGISRYYAELAFAADHGWQAVLKAYHDEE